MNPNVGNEISENPIKEGFLKLIEGIRNLKEFSGNIAELPDELKDIVNDLKKRGVDFSEIDTSRPLLDILIDAYNTNFATGDYYNNKIAYPIDTTRKVVSETVNYTEDVQSRRNAWKKLASKLSIDVSKVNITNSGINIEGVANFELNDSSPASYNELKRDGEGGLTGVPKIEIWEKLFTFMEFGGREQQEIFLTEVMKMDTIRGKTWNFYISASNSRYSGFIFPGLYIGSDKVCIGGILGHHVCSVRRVQN